MTDIIHEKNARIVRQARKIEELDDERNAALDRAERAEALIASQAARIRELEEGLEPFAGYLDTAAYDLDNRGNPLPDDNGMGWVYLTVGHFRRARSLLSRKGGE